MNPMPPSQRPHETRSGGISLTSSLAEMLRQLKNTPDTTARKKPRATREGIRRDSESGASAADADMASRLPPRPCDGQGAGFAIGFACIALAAASSRVRPGARRGVIDDTDRKSKRLNSSHN